ncbi:hypothetical protein JCGZ_18377 [Jatropha curcas]|uniref:Aminotransferase-like plant mobile domain-containing protein n=1 Tax=Jatropha curcas TaxID=180498 RepID=A0A067K1N9_JATCU|nr:hypothetical protein JCGZ_18377 [Jatropha curcas]
MSQTSEIPASTYTPEMETLGALPDTPTFDVPRRDCSSTRQSLEQSLDATVEIRGAAVEVRGASVFRMPNSEQLRDVAVELRGTGSEVCDAAVLQGAKLRQSCVMQLCRRVTRLCSCVTRLRVIWARPARVDQPLMRLRRTLPRFSPAMRYALMERWNDCTHTFVFGFGEMTLTPVDYAAITDLRFTGPVPPLDAPYQTATLGA